MSRFIRKNPNQRVPNLPSRFRAHIWQPLKALICTLFLRILTPVAGRSPNYLAGTYTLKLGLWSGIMILVTQLILFYILWHTLDTIDDITFVDYCREPTPLFARYTWWVSLGVTAVGGAFSLSYGVSSVLTYTPLKDASLAVPLSYLLGGLVAAGLRLLQIWLLNRKWAAQRTVEEGTQWPGLVYRIIQILFLPLGLWVGVSCLLESGWLFVLLGFLYMVGWAVIQPELHWVRILLLVAIAGVFLLRYGKNWRDRRRFLRDLQELSRAGLISYQIVGRPYLSLFSRRVLFGLYIVDAEGTRWQVGVASCGSKRSHTIACQERVLQFRHQIKFRVAPQQSAVGVVVHNGEEMGVWYTTYPVQFPEPTFPEELPAPTRLRAPKKTIGGKPIPFADRVAMVIAPVPHRLSIRVRNDFAPLDNGAEVFGYQTWSQGAFCRFLERKYAGDS